MLGLVSSTWSTGLTVMDDAVLALEAALRLVPIISPGAESAPTENFGEFAVSGFYQKAQWLGQDLGGRARSLQATPSQSSHGLG